MWKWEVEEPKGVVVLVHGAAEHHGRYMWLVKKWNSIGMNVIMGDLPGQGNVPRKKRGHIRSFQEYLEEIYSWIELASEYKLPIFLFGHSMGGLAVIRLLQEKVLPIKAVILSSPCLALVDEPPTILDVLTRGLNCIIPSLRVDNNLSVSKATRNEDIQKQDEHDSLYVTKVSVRWYRELVKAMKLAFRNIDKLPNVPVLLLQGGDDKIVDKHYVSKWFNKVNSSEKVYKEWEHLYHEVFNEPEREEVFQYTRRFVETHIKGTEI